MKKLLATLALLIALSLSAEAVRLKLSFQIMQDDGVTPVSAEQTIVVPAAKTQALQDTIIDIASDPAEPMDGSALAKFRKITVKWWRDAVQNYEALQIRKSKQAEARQAIENIVPIDE